MALPLPPTLSEVRNAVAIRSTIGMSGAISKTAIPLLNEAINQANARIYQGAVWARKTFEVYEPTVSGTRQYDIPDGANGPGGVLTLEVVNEDGNRYPLVHNSSNYIDANEQAANEPGMPLFYYYLGDVIVLDKEVEISAYPQLRFVVQGAPVTMVDDGDRAAVDREALVQLATIYAKTLLNLPFDRTLVMREFEKYLSDMRSNTAEPGETIPLQSQRLMGPTYWLNPSVDALTAPYSVGWNPTGWW
jgi:hypothetical protein